MTRRAAVRAVILVLVIVASFVAARVLGLPDVASLRASVRSAGAAGGLVFVGVYALLALVPAPKAVLTVLGGALFGWWLGAALALLGALIGAVVAFELGRLLGREAVERLVGDRLGRVDSLLRDHGLGAVVAVRLVPLVPFTAINYASGLSGVRRRDYLVGSALGMIPGSVAYSAFGAWGTEPGGVFAAAAGLVVLVLLGGLLGRRLLAGHEGADTGPRQGSA